MDRLLNFQKEPFEEGHKNLLTRVSYSLARRPFVARVLPTVTNQYFASHGAQEDRQDRQILLKSLNNLPAEAEDLILKNVVFWPGNIVLRSSGAHTERWGRDLIFTLLGLENLQPLSYQLNKLTARNYRYPQVPTVQLFPTDREFFFDDETTAMAILARSYLARQGDSLTGHEKDAWQELLREIANDYWLPKEK